MRVLAIGDIHGCFTALATLVDSVPIRPADRVVVLGDFVDRGPDTRAVLDWLIAREACGTLIPLRGNHEVMMSASRRSGTHLHGWLANGGDAALRSYSPDGGPGRLADVPESHWHFLEHQCRPYYETRTHVFVHANVCPDIPLANQPDYVLYWEHFYDTPPHVSGKTMVCGHTPQLTGRPRSIGHAVCIDTRAHAGGWLTCLDVASGRYWQADQRRRTRTGLLNDDA